MDGIAVSLANEKALVAQAAAQPEAFGPIYDHYFTPVYRYVRYRVQDANAAEDITSEVFERALRHITSYRPERGEFALWLLAIARNAVRDHLRSMRRHRWLPIDLYARVASKEPQPDAVSAENEAWRQVEKALRELSDRERDLVALAFGATLSHRQIAAIMDLSESNVGVMLHRTVKRMRAIVQKE